jgi:hypothetical protein
MAATGPNMPLVLQQSGDASRLQDVTQRLGEEQQAALVQQQRNQERRKQSQVQETQNSDAQNQIRPDDDSQQKESRRERSRSGMQADKKEEPAEAARPKTGVVDVVV